MQTADVSVTCARGMSNSSFTRNTRSRSCTPTLAWQLIVWSVDTVHAVPFLRKHLAPTSSILCFATSEFKSTTLSSTSCVASSKATWLGQTPELVNAFYEAWHANVLNIIIRFEHKSTHTAMIAIWLEHITPCTLFKGDVGCQNSASRLGCWHI